MKKMRIPPLAVGIGIYLPMSATFAVVVGAVISHWYTRRTRSGPNPERAEWLGTLVASGLIVGESLWGVLDAVLIVGLSKDAPIRLVAVDFALGPWLGARVRWHNCLIVWVDVASVSSGAVAGFDHAGAVVRPSGRTCGCGGRTPMIECRPSEPSSTVGLLPRR
jgi:OPT oligopeptide transporter protein